MNLPDRLRKTSLLNSNSESREILAPVLVLKQKWPFTACNLATYFSQLTNRPKSSCIRARPYYFITGAPDANTNPEGTGEYMYTNEISTEPIEVLQKWELPFRELMDQIYYTGFSEQLLIENPEDYHREYWYFIQIYS